MKKIYISIFILTSLFSYNVFAKPVLPTIKIKSEDYVVFKYVKIENNEEGLVLSGKVRKTSFGPPSIMGHLDLNIWGPDGNLLKTIPFSYFPKKLSKSLKRPSKFKISIPKNLSPDTTLELTFHRTALNNH